MSHQITLSQAIAGFELYAESRRLSPHTIADYKNTFRKLLNHLHIDPPFAALTRDQLAAFLAIQPVSKKTALNYHTGLSALYTWAVSEQLVTDHLLRAIPKPSPEKPAIVPIPVEDIRKLLDALQFTLPYTRPGKKETRHRLPFADRNRLIILLLLDTGIRASELCSLKIHDIDLRNRRIIVWGKGSKQRSIPISARTSQAAWRYLATRPESRLDEPLIATSCNHPMQRTQLLKLLTRSAHRAGIDGIHPHRFRHTFAINYLRNSGDPYTLQLILGHSTMETVRIYLTIAQADLDAAHRRASPVDHWRL